MSLFRDHRRNFLSMMHNGCGNMFIGGTMCYVALYLVSILHIQKVSLGTLCIRAKWCQTPEIQGEIRWPIKIVVFLGCLFRHELQLYKWKRGGPVDLQKHEQNTWCYAPPSLFHCTTPLPFASSQLCQNTRGKYLASYISKYIGASSFEWAESL